MASGDTAYMNLASKRSMNMKFINIVDPTFNKNNLGKSISKMNSIRLKKALKLHNQTLAVLYNKAY